MAAHKWPILREDPDVRQTNFAILRPDRTSLPSRLSGSHNITDEDNCAGIHLQILFSETLGIAINFVGMLAQHGPHVEDPYDDICAKLT